MAASERLPANMNNLQKFGRADFTVLLATRPNVSRDVMGLPMAGRRASWKMHVAQCKVMAESAMDVAAIGTTEQQDQYLEVAADFLKLAQNIEDQHAGYLSTCPKAANYPERLAA